MAGTQRSQGRGSASAAVAAAAVVVAVLLSLQGTVATNYPVNGTGTWTFDPTYQSWSDAQNFVAGDTITFDYTVGFHDLVTLSQADFATCTVTNPIMTYNSGADVITLSAGTTYFTCGFPSHCSRMKFSAAVAVQEPTVSPSPPPSTVPPPTPTVAPPTPSTVTPPTPSTVTPPTPSTVTPSPPPRTPSTPTPAPRSAPHPAGPTTNVPSTPGPAPASGAVSTVRATLATVFGVAALALVM